MQYLVFEDPITKTYYPVILCNHLDPNRVSINGMRVSSGGLINISPDTAFTMGSSDSHREDETDRTYVGLALQGLSASEFRKKNPVLLFKMAGDDTIRKAFSIQELIDMRGFPEDVVWVSKAEGSPAFDMFFEVTPGGAVKPKEKMSLSDIGLYSECLKRKASGVVGYVTAGYAIVLDKVDNINKLDFGLLRGPELDRFNFKYDSSTGITYWWSDTNDTITAMLDHKLSSMGYKVTRNVIVTKEGNQEATISGKPEEVIEQDSSKPLKKPKKKNGPKGQDHEVAHDE